MKKQKSFCTKCLREVSEETQKCECGGTHFAFGKLKVVENKILCSCGSQEFKKTSHVDFAHKYSDTMMCKCGNVCGVEGYRSEESMGYWED
jgi:hypothetical protein